MWSLHGKDSNAGRDWGQEEKGMTEDEMAGWHHGVDGREFEQTPGDGEGQGSLVCCSPWGHKELDTTEPSYFCSRGVKLSQGAGVEHQAARVPMATVTATRWGSWGRPESEGGSKGPPAPQGRPWDRLPGVKENAFS